MLGRVAGRRSWPGLLALMVVLALACRGNEPLVRLRAERDAVSADGRGAPVALVYGLARAATIDLYVDGPAGQPLYLRRAEPRPAGQDYRYDFDGTYPLLDRPGERRVLPEGSYRLILEAEAQGQRQQVETRLAVRNADTVAPELSDLTVYPALISPNFDGQDDSVALTYRLDKRARVDIWATDGQGRRVYAGPRLARDPGEYREVWDGLDSKHQPLPDGDYQLVVEAADAAGNVRVARAPVTLRSGGTPAARLIDVRFAPRQLVAGGILNVTMIVRNTGTSVLRTQGPEPGFVYSSYDTFASILDRRFVDRAGVWRVGVDWAGSPGGALAKYPYRWGLGREIGPGEEVTVAGAIRVEHGPLQDRQAGSQNNRVYFYAGLLQENMALFDDQVGGAWIELAY